MNNCVPSRGVDLCANMHHTSLDLYTQTPLCAGIIMAAAVKIFHSPLITQMHTTSYNTNYLAAVRGERLYKFSISNADIESYE